MEARSYPSEKVERPFSHPPYQFLIGRVAEIKDDPTVNEVKVQTQFGLFKARILAPNAKLQEGMYYYPEKEDLVLLAFINGDVNFPIILGQIYPDKAVSEYFDNMVVEDIKVPEDVKELRHPIYFRHAWKDPNPLPDYKPEEHRDLISYFEVFVSKDAGIRFHFDMDAKNPGTKFVTLTIADPTSRFPGEKPRIELNTSEKIFITSKDQQIEVDGNVDLTASGNVNVQCQEAKVDAQKVKLGEKSLKGKVVTTLHTCIYSGGPHIDGSSEVEAAK